MLMIPSCCLLPCNSTPATAFASPYLCHQYQLMSSQCVIHVPETLGVQVQVHTTKCMQNEWSQCICKQKYSSTALDSSHSKCDAAKAQAAFMQVTASIVATSCPHKHLPLPDHLVDCLEVATECHMAHYLWRQYRIKPVIIPCS